MLDNKNKKTESPESPAKPPLARTPGLKLLDVFIYPVLNNVGVFLVSVGATYLTARGGDRNAAGKLIYGKIGNFFHQRGESLVNAFRKTGMSQEQAEMSKMVFFSWFDGSLLAPFVKKIEDYREPIAMCADKMMGTMPEDRSVYAAEPKQSWGSVLGGRAATCAIVVPTAYALDKAGLNQKLFGAPGIKLGEWVTKKPWLSRMFGKLDVREIGKVSLFEGFYTSVCTAGLYFSSRFLADWMNKNDKEQKVTPPAMPRILAACAAPAPSRAAKPGAPDALCQVNSVQPAAAPPTPALP